MGNKDKVTSPARQKPYVRRIAKINEMPIDHSLNERRKKLSALINTFNSYIKKKSVLSKRVVTISKGLSDDPIIKKLLIEKESCCNNYKAIINNAKKMISTKYNHYFYYDSLTKTINNALHDIPNIEIQRKKIIEQIKNRLELLWPSSKDKDELATLFKNGNSIFSETLEEWLLNLSSIPYDPKPSHETEFFIQQLKKQVAVLINILKAKTFKIDNKQIDNLKTTIYRHFNLSTSLFSKTIHVPMCYEAISSIVKNVFKSNTSGLEHLNINDIKLGIFQVYGATAKLKNISINEIKEYFLLRSLQHDYYHKINEIKNTLPNQIKADIQKLQTTLNKCDIELTPTSLKGDAFTLLKNIMKLQDKLDKFPPTICSELTNNVNQKPLNHLSAHVKQLKKLHSKLKSIKDEYLLNKQKVLSLHEMLKDQYHVKRKNCSKSIINSIIQIKNLKYAYTIASNQKSFNLLFSKKQLSELINKPELLESEYIQKILRSKPALYNTVLSIIDSIAKDKLLKSAKHVSKKIMDISIGLPNLSQYRSISIKTINDLNTNYLNSAKDSFLQLWTSSTNTLKQESKCITQCKFSNENPYAEAMANMINLIERNYSAFISHHDSIKENNFILDGSTVLKWMQQCYETHSYTKDIIHEFKFKKVKADIIERRLQNPVYLLSKNILTMISNEKNRLANKYGSNEPRLPALGELHLKFKSVNNDYINRNVNLVDDSKYFNNLNALVKEELSNNHMEVYSDVKRSKFVQWIRKVLLKPLLSFTHKAKQLVRKNKRPNHFFVTPWASKTERQLAIMGYDFLNELKKHQEDSNVIMAPA